MKSTSNVMPSGPYTDVPGAAARYHAGESTVRAWVRYLGMPSIRAGRCIRIKIEEADRWYEQGGPSGLPEALKAAAEARAAKAPPPPSQHGDEADVRIAAGAR